MKKLWILAIAAILSVGSAHALEMRGDTMYFLFLDRFHDGNPDNNTGRNPETYSSDKSDLKKYLGGDIQGLIDKLDYLKGMGISAIWVTPPADNVDGLTKGGDAAYHGYWAKDFFSVDEHLGAWEDIVALAREMHKPERNMKLILDFAPNHSNPNDENEFGALYKDGIFLVDHANDPRGWYHHNGGVADWNDWNQVRNHNLFNLSDFDQGKLQVYRYLTGAAIKWVDAGVDGIRIDAIKHMDKSFILAFTNDLTAYANARGRDGMYFFGEWFGAGAWAAEGGIDHMAIDYANTSGSALLDFGLRDAMERVMCNRPGHTMRTLNQYLEDRDGVFSSPDWQIAFLDNHDMARFSTALRSSNTTFGPGNTEAGGGFDEEFAKRRLEMAIAVIMTVRGIPCIYYGTEHYAADFTMNPFGQVGSDPYNREMMPSFDQNSRLYGMIRTLADLRRESGAIQKGSYKEKWLNDDILVYERKLGGDVVIVGVNRGPSGTFKVINLDLADGAYKSLLGNDVIEIADGAGVFRLSQNEVIVLHKAEGN